MAQYFSMQLDDLSPSERVDHLKAIQEQSVGTVEAYLLDPENSEQSPSEQDFLRYATDVVDRIKNVPVSTTSEQLDALLQNTYEKIDLVQSHLSGFDYSFGSDAWHAYLQKTTEIARSRIKTISDIIRETIYPSTTNWGLEDMMSELTHLVGRVYGQKEGDSNVEKSWHALQHYFREDLSSEERLRAKAELP
jgi:hypothetical protein